MVSLHHGPPTLPSHTSRGRATIPRVGVWRIGLQSGAPRRSSAALLMLCSLGVLLAGCGGGSAGSPTHGTSPGARPTGVSQTEPLMAVLEPGGIGQVAAAHDRVAVVRLNGRAVAKQAFSARAVPRIGNAAPVMQPEAFTAGGKVYYVDGFGQVRSLAPDGPVLSVTRFPLVNAQQVLSFVVSPDGAKLVATVFSWPPVHNPPPQTPVQPAFGPGDMTLDVYTAVPGQAPVRVHHQVWAQSNQLPRDVVQVVAWAANGPLVTTDTVLGTQQPLPGQRFFGHLAELAADGNLGQRIGGPSCGAVSVIPDETVLCLDAALTTASVRTRVGGVVYSLPSVAGASYQGAVLSPDGQKAVYGSTVINRDGGKVSLPPQFYTEGWLDDQTLVGVQFTNQGESDLDVLRLSSPKQVTDLGFKGIFVGKVQGP